MSWWWDAIQAFKQRGSTGTAICLGDFLSLELIHVSTWLQHVVTTPTGNGHKCYYVMVVANFLNVGADFLNNFLLSLLAVGWLSGIHFVNTNKQLFHTQYVSQKGMLTGLHAHGSAHSWRYTLKFTNTGSNHQDSTVSRMCP